MCVSPAGASGRTRACCLSGLKEKVVLPGEAVYTKHKAIEATADFFSLRSDCFYSTIPETLRSGSTREGSHGLLNARLAPAGWLQLLTCTTSRTAAPHKSPLARGRDKHLMKCSRPIFALLPPPDPPPPAHGARNLLPNPEFERCLPVQSCSGWWAGSSSHIPTQPCTPWSM